MNIAEYSRMAKREQSYWWHVGRLETIDTWLRHHVRPSSRAKILNVGCGTGGTLPVLEKYGNVTNVDVSPEAIKYMRKNGYKVIKVQDFLLPFKDREFDVVVAFDVLEHIKEHEEALSEWSRVLKKNGAILFTVPAYQWLWSDHDVSLHHHRRYTKKLIRRIKPASVSINRSSYFISFSLPMVVGFRFLNKVLGRKSDSETSYVNVPSWVNSLFIKFLWGESGLQKYITFPFGTSVITMMRKK